MAASVHPASATGAPTGFGGWLLLLCLWLGLVSPIWGIALLWMLTGRMDSVNPNEAELFRASGMATFVWSVTAVRETLRIGAAALLYFRRRPSTVWIVTALIWLSGPVLIPASAAIHWPAEISSAGLGRSALVALAASLYLLLSRRVRNTYGFRLGQ